MHFKSFLGAGLILVATGIAAWLWLRPPDTEGGMSSREGKGAPRAVPVELATIERGPIERRRTFSGTLEPHGELVVAPKIAGRIEELAVDLADTVTQGQVVARLDNAERVQAVAQAEADLAVARANLAEAKSLLAIAERELERVDKLRDRGVSSESQRDLAKADQLAKQAHLAVTEAQVTRSQAALATARIRLGYTEVAAHWRGHGEERVVAERHVDEGETVSPNEPLYRLVDLDPIKGLIFVTEGDYALLAPGRGGAAHRRLPRRGLSGQDRPHRTRVSRGHAPGARRARGREPGSAPQARTVHSRHPGAGAPHRGHHRAGVGPDRP
jgi:RND family efflux transporter MFP subunit